ncbi:hypothetical protein FQR65_LT20184 [Abscondita terminalis]|nr:hypothetical protein FQR65_LT20184 [Abscondita terminalis]
MRCGLPPWEQATIWLRASRLKNCRMHWASRGGCGQQVSGAAGIIAQRWWPRLRRMGIACSVGSRGTMAINPPSIQGLPAKAIRSRTLWRVGMDLVHVPTRASRSAVTGPHCRQISAMIDTGPALLPQCAREVARHWSMCEANKHAGGTAGSATFTMAQEAGVGHFVASGMDLGAWAAPTGHPCGTVIEAR